MWIAIELFEKANVSRKRVDLLVKRGRRVIRVPDCRYQSGQWRSEHNDRMDDGQLRSTDEPIYFMQQYPWPPSVDHHRRK